MRLEYCVHILIINILTDHRIIFIHSSQICIKKDYAFLQDERALLYWIKSNYFLEQSIQNRLFFFSRICSIAFLKSKKNTEILKTWHNFLILTLNLKLYRFKWILFLIHILSESYTTEKKSYSETHMYSTTVWQIGSIF